MTDIIRRELIVLRETVRIITEALDRIERGLIERDDVAVKNTRSAINAIGERAP